jgi:CBS domain-containing protein
MRINQVLAGKGSSEVVTVPPDASVRDLIAMLAEHNIGALVVSGDGARVDGIVSERDVVRRLHERGHGMLESTVADLMTSEVVTCKPTDRAADLARIMTDRRIRHLPVCEAGRLCGIVSIGDLVKARIDELEREREQLASYISG